MTPIGLEDKGAFVQKGAYQLRRIKSVLGADRAAPRNVQTEDIANLLADTDTSVTALRFVDDRPTGVCRSADPRGVRRQVPLWQ